MCLFIVTYFQLKNKFLKLMVKHTHKIKTINIKSHANLMIIISLLYNLN